MEFLTGPESAAIEAQVAGVESRTGVQIVTAVVGKSDTYVELPWKAFALGASLAAFGVVLAETVRPEWVTARTALLHAVTILGVAAASALLAVFVPAVRAGCSCAPPGATSRCGSTRSRCFSRASCSAPRRRTSVLVLVSLFERRIEILPDTGLHDRVTEADWRAVIARMTPLLRQARPFHALQEGLDAVEALLAAKGFRAAGAGRNDLPDRPIEERGE